MREKFNRAFSEEQSEILSDVIDHAYSDLVKTGDFNELKDIVKNIGIHVEMLAEAQKRTEIMVKELAEAQKRTEIMVKELAGAQKRTEEELHELVTEHKDTRQQVGGLAQSVGYGLEDKIMPFMKDFALRYAGIKATIVKRKNLIYPNGKFDELNIYVEGTKDGRKAFLIGECKAKVGKKDVERFHQMIERVKGFLESEVSCFMVGYSIDPPVENYLRENYPQTGFFMSYEFEMEYNKI
jgi:hypothetical protein